MKSSLSLKDRKMEETRIFCSFCGKSINNVEVMFESLGLLYICIKCVRSCMKIMEEKRKGTSQDSEHRLEHLSESPIG